MCWCKKLSPASGALKQKASPTLPSHTRNSKPSNPAAAPPLTRPTPNTHPPQKTVRLVTQRPASGPAAVPNPNHRTLPPPSHLPNTANVHLTQPTPPAQPPFNQLSCSRAPAAPPSTLRSPTTTPNPPHRRRSHIVATSIAITKTTNPRLQRLLGDPDLHRHWPTIIADATGLAQGDLVIWRVPRHHYR